MRTSWLVCSWAGRDVLVPHRGSRCANDERAVGSCVEPPVAPPCAARPESCFTTPGRRLTLPPWRDRQQLAEDLNRAMKARDMPRVYVLRGWSLPRRTSRSRNAAPRWTRPLIQIVRREVTSAKRPSSRPKRAHRRHRAESRRACDAGHTRRRRHRRGSRAIIRAIAGAGRRLAGAMWSARAHAGRFDGKVAAAGASRARDQAAPPQGQDAVELPSSLASRRSSPRSSTTDVRLPKQLEEARAGDHRTRSTRPPSTGRISCARASRSSRAASASCRCTTSRRSRVASSPMAAA